MSFSELLIFESDSPILSISVKCQSPHLHVHRNPNDVSCLKLGTIRDSRWVAIVSGLPIVDRPSRSVVAKCFTKGVVVGSCDSNLEELSLVDENLKIVPSSFPESLCSHDGLEPTALFGSACETFGVELQLFGAFLQIPREFGGVVAFRAVHHDFCVFNHAVKR